MISFFQKYNINVVKKNKNNYEINYSIDSKAYCIRVKKKSGPSSIIMATDEKVTNNETTDVTDKIVSYLGPNEDFHGYQTKPSDLNFEKLTLMYSNGEEKVFEKDDYITIEVD